MHIADDQFGSAALLLKRAVSARSRARRRADSTARFGAAPRWLAAAPGRVNLIGEHTDYTGGFALPMAIDRYTVIAGGPAPVRGACAPAPALSQRGARRQQRRAARRAAASGRAHAGRTTCAAWSRSSSAAAIVPPSLDAFAVSDVPLGSGLSSSASLEVSTATLLEAATGATLDRLEKARLCRQAEHEYAHVPCGLMDQLTAVLGDESGPLLVDFEAESARLVPLRDPDVTVLICNSNVPPRAARRRVRAPPRRLRGGGAPPQHPVAAPGDARGGRGGAGRPRRRGLPARAPRRHRERAHGRRRRRAGRTADSTDVRRAHVPEPPVAARRLRGQLPRARHAGRDRAARSARRAASTARA